MTARIPSVDERPVSKYLRYSHNVTDEIIALDNFEYMAVIKVAGRAPDAYSIEERCEWIEALHNVVRGLPMGQVGLYSHTVRRKVREFPVSNFSEPFAARFDRAYRATVEKQGLMLNELYLTVLMHPISDPVLGAFAALEKGSSERAAQWQEESVERLKQALRGLKAGLYRYGPETLQIVERDGVLFSEPAEFLAFLLSGEHRQIPVTRNKMSADLPHARPRFALHGALGELRNVEGSRLFGMIELTGSAEDIEPGAFDALTAMAHEFVLSQSWGSFTANAALAAVKKQRRLMKDSNDDSVSQIEELDFLLDDLKAGRAGLGDHHATLCIYGEDPTKIKQAMGNICSKVAEKGIMMKPLDRALEAGFWAQLPGNWAWRPRPVAITAANFLCYSSMHNQLTGKPVGNPWGEAVTMFKTVSGSPFFFNYHASVQDLDESGRLRPGNTMIIGMTGTGKTVLQGVLLTQARKFGYTGVVWDKDQGLQVLIMQLGGRYFKIRLGVPTGWNPYQMEPTKTNVAFMRRLTVYLAERRGGPVTPKQQREITEAVDQMTTLMDRNQRSLSTLNTLLPDPYSDDGDKTTVHGRLAPWCRGGEFGWVFDNSEDLLDLGTSSSRAPLFGFDLTELLDVDEVRGPATMYLRHRVKMLRDGRRVVDLYDECQHPLKDEHFQLDMQDDARTIRKMNGVMALSTQEPEAIADNPVGPSLIQQSATLIFLPNPKAKRSTYIDKFGLTPSEFDLLMTLGEASRKFLIKQGGNVTVAELDLSECQDELLVFSGSPDMAEIAEKAVAQAGEDPADWLPIYLAEVKRQRG